MKNATCAVDGCDRPAGVPGTAKGLCSGHYRRLNKYGDPLGMPPIRPRKPRRRTRPETCSVEGCDGPHKAQGLCSKHYHRLIRHGDPLGGGTERLYIVGAPCRFEGCELPSVGQGYCSMHVARLRRGQPLDGRPAYRYRTSSGYIVIIPDATKRGTPHSNQRISEHRWVMEQHLGRTLTTDENVHHINGVRDDNRLENLELWSESQPSGQRALDKLAWAREIVALYGPLDEAGLI